METQKRSTEDIRMLERWNNRYQKKIYFISLLNIPLFQYSTSFDSGQSQKSKESSEPFMNDKDHRTEYQ